MRVGLRQRPFVREWVWICVSYNAVMAWWKRSRGREGPLRIQRKGNAGGGARHMYGTRGENIKREKVCVKCETEGGKVEEACLWGGRGED